MKDHIMNTGARIRRYAFVASLIVVTLLSMYVAIQTYRNYGIVARGILGIVVLITLLWETFGDGCIQ
jgi:lipopolysaccharide export LptBFGC system permease protein LptF